MKLRRFMPPTGCRGLLGLMIASVLTVVPLHGAEARQGSNPNDSGEAEIARCIRQAAEGKAWLEKTLWGLRDQEGGWIGAEVRNADGSHDLGPLQINSWWVPRLADILGRPVSHIRFWLRFDPCFNAEAARWIFLSGLATTGDYWKAIGVYHSPTDWRQRRYAASVAAHLSKRFGKAVFRPR